MSASRESPSIPQLFGDAVEQLGKLVHNEVQLARAEMSEKMAEAGRGAAYLGAAAILVIPVLTVLLIALALWLNQMGMPLVGSLLAAAAVGGLVSIILGLTGLNRLKPAKLKPTVTLHQVELDVAAARELAK